MVQNSNHRITILAILALFETIHKHGLLVKSKYLVYLHVPYITLNTNSDDSCAFNFNLYRYKRQIFSTELHITRFGTVTTFLYRSSVHFLLILFHFLFVFGHEPEMKFLEFLQEYFQQFN